ncbi:MAG: VPLPA-CTERM sorting domain-containing protein [Pseudomonadota bacterium]
MRVIAVLMAFCVAMAGAANAATVTVNNHSFENGTTDWVTGGTVGTFSPAGFPSTGAAFIAGVDGSDVGFSNNGGFSQVLTDTVAAGEYTLTVAVGDRADTSLPVYIVRLLAGTTTIADATDPSITSGWADVVASVTIADGDALIGQNLAIELVGFGTQVNFDNVRLDFELATGPAPIPLPASVLLLGGAIGGMSLLRRRRKPA